ncbi:MAG: carboxypeptidase-like regulatory domain-containing protein [Myxococcota bacterium]
MAARPTVMFLSDPAFVESCFRDLYMQRVVPLSPLGCAYMGTFEKGVVVMVGRTLALLMLLVACGSEPHGELHGTVSLYGAESAAGVQVRLSNGRHATTSSDGRFAFKRLPIGVYELRLAAEGFPEKVVRDVAVAQAAVGVAPIQLTRSAPIWTGRTPAGLSTRADTEAVAISTVTDAGDAIVFWTPEAGAVASNWQGQLDAIEIVPGGDAVLMGEDSRADESFARLGLVRAGTAEPIALGVIEYAWQLISEYSPDGAWLTVEVQSAPDDAWPWALLLARVDGSEPVIVASNVRAGTYGFSPDSLWLAWSIGADEHGNGGIGLRELATGESQRILATPQPWELRAFSPDGAGLFAVSLGAPSYTGGALAYHDYASASWQEVSGCSPDTPFAVAPTGAYALLLECGTTGDTHHVVRWDRDSGVRTVLAQNARRIPGRAVSFTADAAHILAIRDYDTFSGTGTLEEIDALTGLREVIAPGVYPGEVSYGPTGDSATFYFGSDIWSSPTTSDGVLAVWQREDNHFATIGTYHFAGVIGAPTFSVDGRFLLHWTSLESPWFGYDSRSSDFALWDMAAARDVTLPGPIRGVDCVEYSPDGRYLAFVVIAQQDYRVGPLSLVDLASGTSIAVHPRARCGFGFTRDRLVHVVWSTSVRDIIDDGVYAMVLP